MPLNSTRGAGSAKGFGLTSGGEPAPLDVDYLVVAGGAGTNDLAGSGAGGMRTSFPGGTKIQLSKLNTITVGAGGTGGTRGADSSIVSKYITLTSAGGGKGAGDSPGPATTSRDGGAGGGGTSTGPSQPTPVGQGNTPPVSPPQGANGGAKPYIAGGGGGGGGASGTNGQAGQALPQPSNPPFNGLGNGGDAGNGTATSISGSPVTYAGGGGGGAYWPNYNGGAAGAGGGGAGGRHPQQGCTAQPGTANTGGGAGGPQGPAKNGGSGIIILRYPTASAPRLTFSPGVTTQTTGSCTYATFNASGTADLK